MLDPVTELLAVNKKWKADYNSLVTMMYLSGVSYLLGLHSSTNCLPRTNILISSKKVDKSVVMHLLLIQVLISIQCKNAVIFYK